MAAKRPAKKPAEASPLDVRGPFVPEGPIEWAVLAELDPATLTSVAFRVLNRHRVRSMWDLDAPRSWDVVPGKKRHAALIQTAPGSMLGETYLAEAISREVPTAVYALGFAGCDDPDHGLPSVALYVGGAVAPKRTGASSGDPFDVAEALGCTRRGSFRGT